jgi:hypothetical protein
LFRQVFPLAGAAALVTATATFMDLHQYYIALK